ncbi:MAG: hypothetical protein PHX18_00245 [Candidatus Gastranaerophilales bacterium]|nr:hypothetical protein [Candidatus Gastranaerophilales bacterium]
MQVNFFTPALAANTNPDVKKKTTETTGALAHLKNNTPIFGGKSTETTGAIAFGNNAGAGGASGSSFSAVA